MFRTLIAVIGGAAACSAAPLLWAADADSNTATPTLEQRVEALEQQAANPPPQPAAGARAFNPAISVVLNGTAAHFSRDPEDYTLPGFALGEEAGPGTQGLSLGESEINLEANIDDWFFGSVTAALAEEDGETHVELEESYIQTLQLPAGLTAKGGRFFSRMGYLNEFHAHADDFVDRPLAYRALLGGKQYGDDGVQLRWLAPTDLFVELGAEAFRGNGFPGGGGAHGGVGTWTVFSHIGGDIGDSLSYRTGLSYLDTEARDRETGDGPDTYSGNSRLIVADFVLKWAPHGNPKNTNLKLQAEYLQRKETGTFNGDDYAGKQHGYYVQGAWQFMPNWRTALRYDRLSADNSGAAVAGSALDDQGHQPQRYSALLEFDRSEFSRLRLQYNRDESGPEADNQLFLNYVFNLGAHGAHAF